MAKPPSKNFKEIIPAGEDEKFASYAQKLRSRQIANNKKYGKGRMLHRKGTLALKAEFNIHKSLPAHAAQGIFAKAGKYDAVIRLSNGSFDIKSDRTPDIRGFAVKVRGVSGKGALGNAKQTEQDFVMINHVTFSVARAEEFLDLLLAVTKSPGALLKHLYGAHGFFGMFKAIASFAKLMAKKFSGYMTENFSTVLPIKNGDYAVKLRIVPQNGELPSASKSDLTADVKGHLATKALRYQVELQFYTDADSTPIEDASKAWSETESPFIAVGELVIPVQETSGASYEKFAAEVETMKFDPWNAIEEHRPLGNVMRARKAAYYASQQERGV